MRCQGPALEEGRTGALLHTVQVALRSSALPGGGCSAVFLSEVEIKSFVYSSLVRTRMSCITRIPTPMCRSSGTGGAKSSGRRKR